jgi:hypothetical protein
MTDIEKLRVLLPHWMEHNKEHTAEFASWAEKLSLAGHEEIAQTIHCAAEKMQQANDTLQLALNLVGDIEV